MKETAGAVPKRNKFIPLFSQEGHAKTAAKLPGMGKTLVFSLPVLSVS